MNTEAVCMSKKIPTYYSSYIPLQKSRAIESFFVVLWNYEKRLKNPFGTNAICVYLLYVSILLKPMHDE